MTSMCWSVSVCQYSVSDKHIYMDIQISVFTVAQEPDCCNTHNSFLYIYLQPSDNIKLSDKSDKYFTKTVSVFIILFRQNTEKEQKKKKRQMIWGMWIRAFLCSHNAEM